MYTLLAVFGLVVCFVYYYITRTFRYWSKRNVKGPKPIPFFGNFRDAALRRQHADRLHRDLYKQYPKEKVVGFYRMTSPCLLVRDLDVIKQILIKDFEVFPDRGSYFSKEGLTQNIFHSEVETWRILRSRFSPMFTTCKFKKLFNLLDECGNKFVNYINEVTIKNSEQDIYDLYMRYGVDTTMCAIFSMEIDTYNDDIFKLFTEIDKYFIIPYDRELDMIFPGAVKKLNRSLLTKELIEFCHQLLKTGLNKSSDVSNYENNIMDVLRNMKREGIAKQINNGKESLLETTDDLLAGQTWVAFFAGYANSSLVFTYAMYHLAYNPDVQDHLIDEIDKAITRNDGKFNYETLKDMKYVEMVFEETLRMNPLTNGLQRHAVQNIKLEGVELVVEKGTNIIISPYAIQHDEQYFPEPHKFNPERFSSENVTNRHPCAFLSFGAGRRGCLGSRFTHIQLGIALTKVMSKFKVEPTKNTISSIKYSATKLLLTPEEKICLRLVPRQ